MHTHDFQFQSRCLGERRNISVSLPRHPDPARPGIVLFCTDGQTVDAFARRIKRELSEQEFPSVVIVGAHSSQYRSQEYTPGENQSRFRRHEHFFVEELPQWLHAEFGLKADRNRTAVFGVSLGGAFALTMAARHRNLFGLVIAFSVAGLFESYQRTQDANETTPRFYLSAGSREKPLLKRTRQFASQLHKSRIECVVTSRPASHDFHFWEAELPLALKWGFKG